VRNSQARDIGRVASTVVFFNVARALSSIEFHCNMIMDTSYQYMAPASQETASSLRCSFQCATVVLCVADGAICSSIQETITRSELVSISHSPVNLTGLKNPPLGRQRSYLLAGLSLTSHVLDDPPNMLRFTAAAAALVAAAALTIPSTNKTVTTRACQPPYDTFPFCNTSLPLGEVRICSICRLCCDLG
jgi:hypothetical protein